jgi:GH25 family lysozyme M1 (1,4-beta-N-acetylmuramidase)
MTLLLCLRPAFSWKGWLFRLMLPLGLALLPGVEPAQAQRAMGTDVSHWQGTGINWLSVKNAGVTFAWCKATEATTYKDDTFTVNQAGAKANGILVGAYHFARPSRNPNITGANSADSEAAYFWGVVSNYVKTGGTYLVPMLDWEDPACTNQLTAATMSSWVNQWCNTVSNFARANGAPGIKPIIYTGTWYSRPSSTYSGLTTAVTIWPGWIAAYPSGTFDPQTGGPSSSYPWSSWTIWQYGDTNWSGGDSDVFNGTLATLKSTLVIGTNTNPPAITSAPSNRYADRGGTLKLSVGADGPGSLSYQWRCNGTNITGATTNVYTLSNIQTSNAGSYTVVVTNLYGRATSSVATVTLNPPFATVLLERFDTNSAANWTVNKSSTDTRATFAYDYSAMGIPSAPNSTGSTTKGLRLEANVSLTNVAAVSCSPIGQSFGGNYRLHFDMWINANGPFPGGGNGSTESISAGVGTAGNRVQWTGSGTTADGVWFIVDGEGGASDSSTTLGDFNAFIGTTVEATNSGVFAAGTGPTVRANINPYYLNVFPGGQAPPASQAANYSKQNGTLDVGTVGFAWRNVIVNKTGNTVEWYIDGLKLATVSGVSATASNIFVGFWDPYTSLTDNTNVSFGLVDNLRVEIPAVAPAIAAQPQALAVKVTSNASFTVSATGIPAPACQWRFNGTNLANATAASYTRTNAQYADAGAYSVLVTNLAGAITSSPAALSIITASPAQFQVPVVQTNGWLQLVLSGDSGATYYVQSSTNLVDWQPFTNLTLINGAFTFNAGWTTNGAALYFRARSGP